LFWFRCFKDLPMLALKEQAEYRSDDASLQVGHGIGRTSRPSTPSCRSPESTPLRVLAEGGLSAKFRSWRGASGRRYVFSVYDRHSCPAYSDAVLVIASALADGGRKIVFVADTGCFPDMVVANAAAKFAGAFEFHVHLLARAPDERRALIADISHAGRS
jgi:hypothetical protein